MTQGSPDEKELRRLARLRALQVLDSAPEPAFDSLARVAAAICGTPIALISLIDQDRQWFKANIGLEGTSETPRSQAFCDHAIRQEQVMEVPDAQQDARFTGNPLVTGAPHIRFYAGAPIVLSTGESIGTLCVIDRRPASLTPAQLEGLRELASVARAMLEQRAQLAEIVSRDIALRETTERELRTANSFLARAETLSGVGGWEVDLVRQTVKWTDQAYRIFESQPGTPIGLEHHRRYFDKPALDAIDATYARAIGQNEPWDIELPCVTQTGRPIWIRSAGHAEFEDGMPVRLVGVLQDITAIKAERERQQEAHRLLAAVVENLPCAVSVFDGDFRLIAHNQQFRTLLDFPDALFEGRQAVLEDFVRFDAGRGEYGDEPPEKVLVRVAQQAATPSRHVMLRSHAGAPALEVRRAPMPGGGFVTTYMDITQARAAEQALARAAEITRATLEATTDGILVVGTDGEILYYNHNFLNMWRIPPTFVWAGSAALVRHVVPQVTEPERFSRRIEELQAAPLEEANDEVHLKDGRIFERRARTMLVEGEAMGRVWSFRDVTEERRSQAEIQRAREAAESANRAKSEFMDNVSHEIRTPLNGVIGMTQLLGAEPLTPQQRRYVALADASARELLELINDLLDLGKIEAGKVDLENAPFRLDEVTDHLAELYVLRAREKNLGFRVEIAPGVPLRVTGDATRLRQILNNLLSNALKFTEEGEFGLVVSRAPAGRGGDLISFTVHDSGIGIAPEARERLFTRFSQADSSTTRRFGGTGLGLAIVRQLCELMGGTVTLQSEPGRGSSFRCELPLPEAAGPLPGEEAPQAPGRAAVRAARLLIAEDNPVNQIVVQGLLAHAGYEDVVIVNNGREAVEAARREAFDAVLMDCRMPEMDGYQATALLREGGFVRPIIALTANASEAERERCLAQGMNDFLSKPIDGRQLAEALARWLQSDREPAAPAASAESGPAGAVFDREKSLRQLGGDEDLLAMALLSYRQTAPQLLEKALTAMESGDAKELHRHLHTLAGSSGMMGSDALLQAARRLESHVDANEWAQVREGMPQLQDLLERFMRQSGA